MKNKMGNCKACGQEIALSANSCPHCGMKNKKPILKKWWFWLIIIVFIGLVVSVGGSTNDEAASTGDVNTEVTKATVSAVTSVFDGDCGIRATAEIGSNIINMPEIGITITNTTEKEIAAIQFFVVPYDVYGDEIKGWTTQNKLYTDESIAAGKTTTISYQLIEQTVKTVDLYVYSVYFADGTEWGNKDATNSQILDNGALIQVDVK